MGVKITGGSAAQYPRTEAHVLVKTKASWSDEWELDSELEPQRASRHTGAHDLDSCVLLRRYGPAVYNRYTGTFTNRDWGTRLDEWVQLILIGDEGIQVVWQGRISDERRDLRARNEIFVAYGGLDILRKIHVNHCHWWDGSEVLELGRVPSVNLSGQDDLLAGNRSTDAHGASYVYERRTDGGTQAVWSHYDYLKYLLQRFVNVEGAPTWTIGGQREILQDLHTYIPLRGGESVADLLVRLIPPRYGIDCVIVPTDAGFEIRVFVLTGGGQAFGAAELPENPNTLAFTLDATHDITEAVVEFSHTQQYDHIRIVGERKRTQFSLYTNPTSPDVRKLWTDAQETAYKAGTGTPSDPAAKHDNARRDDRFANVFQGFGAVADYGFFNGYHLPPLLDLSGEETTGTPAQQKAERATLPRLLTRQGWDYTGATPSHSGVAGAEADFMPPLALVKVQIAGHELEGKWIPLDRVNGMAAETGIAAQARTIEVLSDEWGLRLNMEPNHALAQFHWLVYPSNFEPSTHGFDWEEMYLTIAIETDERLELGFDLSPGLGAGDGSTLVVRAPGCHYWYLAPDTYLGVDAGGQRIGSHSEGIVLRNDIDRMRLLAAGAIARYAFGRARARITERRLENWGASLGSILTTLKQGQEGDADYDLTMLHVPVTSVEWNFREGERTTSLAAGYAR